MITAGAIGLPEQSTSSGISLRGRTVPSYIAVEGPIGVGKTTLARRIAAPGRGGHFRRTRLNSSRFAPRAPGRFFRHTRLGSLRHVLRSHPKSV